MVSCARLHWLLVRSQAHVNPLKPRVVIRIRIFSAIQALTCHSKILTFGALTTERQSARKSDIKTVEGLGFKQLISSYVNNEILNA